MELKPDSLLNDRYRIESRLGQGGMGAVYLGYDTALDTQVAIKANMNPGSHSTRQFLREAKLLASLRNPNLPRVTDYFILEDVEYLVMDYVPGEDLSARMKASGPQPLGEVIKWAEQLGQALMYLHTQDSPIVHRDIKPSNIKITPSGQVMLVDFGIAKKSDSSATTTGARGYTPGYAPPEQYGSGKTGPFTDQYALAATLYALLSGEAPAESVDRMLGNAHLKPLREYDASIPENVAAAIERALAIQPEERFPSVADFTNALKDSKYRPELEATIASGSAATRRAPAEPAAATRVSVEPRRKAGLLPRVLAGVVVLGLLGAGGVYLFNNGGLPFGGGQTVSSGLLDLGEASTATPTVDAPTLPPEPTGTLGPTAAPTQTGGGLIAFVSNRADGIRFQIFTMNSDGSNVEQLTFDDVNKSQPAWSPDGARLLYVADGGRDQFGNNLGLDIWLLDFNTGAEPLNLTHSPGDDYDPAWSHDAAFIAFTSERQFEQRNIHIMRPDGTDVRNVTLGRASEFSPAYSSDGAWLAFATSIRSAPARLFLRNSAGFDPRPFDLSERLGEVDHPAWSPDGQLLAYTGINEGIREIWIAVVQAAGAELFQLTSSLNSIDPAWSGDSQYIVFVSFRDGNPEIYVMDSLGNNEVNLTNNLSIDRDPAWQPAPFDIHGD